MDIKFCWGCEKDLSTDDFGPDKRSRDGLNGRCRACRNGKANTEYATKPERRAKAKAEQKARYENDPQPIIDRAAQWQIDNAQRHGEFVKAWTEVNRDKVRAIKRNAQNVRRARKLGAFVEEVDSQICFDRHGGICYLCDSFITGAFHIDHVVPLSRGGEHSYANCRPTHPSCNVWKNDRPLEELDFDERANYSA